MASRRIRAATKAIAFAALFAVCVAAGTAIAWTMGVSGVASAAGELDEVDLALGSSAIARSATHQAVLFAVDEANGTADAEALALALAEARTSIEAYERLVSQTSDHSEPPATAPLEQFASDAFAVVAAIEASDLDGARELAATGLETSYAGAAAALDSARMSLVDRIDTASSWTASTEAATRIAVTLGIPFAVALMFWLVSRRRVRRSWNQAAVEIESLEGQLEQSKQALVSLSHRFRTPLTSIYGLSDVLVQKHQRQDLERELITLIHSESSEANRIADDALAATQLAAGTMETSSTIVAFSEVVEEAVKPFRATGVELKVECPEIWVLTDAAKVQHILRNLVSNAVTHGAEPVFVEVSEANGFVDCDVIDHGDAVATGVRPDQVDFDPGTGLGLKVAYELAELIGAKLDHYRDGDRTQFTLSLSEEEGEGADPDGKRIVRRLPKPLKPSEEDGDDASSDEMSSDVGRAETTAAEEPSED